MFFIEKTYEFDKWFRKLKDLKPKQKFCLEFNKLKITVISEIVNLLVMEFEKCE